MSQTPNPRTSVTQFDNLDLASIWARLAGIATSIIPTAWTFASEGAITLGANFNLAAPTGYIRVYKQIKAVFASSATAATRRVRLVTTWNATGDKFDIVDSPYVQTASLTYTYIFNDGSGAHSFFGATPRATLYTGQQYAMFAARASDGTQLFKLQSDVENIQGGAPEDQFTGVTYIYQDIAIPTT